MGQFSSDLLAAGTQVGEDGIDAVLVDGAQGGTGNTQLDPTVLRSDPEAALVRLGRKRRRVLFMACETLLPVVVRLPVTWQIRAIRTSKGNECRP